MALVAKHDQRRHRVFCLLSDGDCNEGSTWEAIMFAAKQLTVACAFHSPVIGSAGARFGAVLDGVPLASARASNNRSAVT